MSPLAPDPPSHGAWDMTREHQIQRTRRERLVRWVPPILVVLASIGAWEAICVFNEIPSYILPRPGVVLRALWADGPLLMASLGTTLSIALGALGLAIIGGVGLAILFAQSKWIEMAFFPYAIILQVTPVIAIAPLIFIYVDNTFTGLLICAWIVAFFPILSNTIQGLRSSDHNLRDLMQLYEANRWQVLWYLQLPSALPYFLAGLKVASGLALIGAIVAEFVAGTGGAHSGLAFRILEASYRLNIPRMYAAIVLVCVTGIVLFALTSALSYFLMRKWHDSERARDF